MMIMISAMSAHLNLNLIKSLCCHYYFHPLNSTVTLKMGIPSKIIQLHYAIPPYMTANHAE